MSTNSFAILFYPKIRSANAGEATLYCRITYKRKRAEFSLQRKVNMKSWDPNRSRYRGSSGSAQKMNIYLQQVHADIFDVYDQLRRSKAVLSATLIKDRYLHTEESEQTVLMAITHHYQVAQKTIREGTLKNYRSTERYIKLFITEVLKVEDVYLSELSMSFITRLDHYLRSYQPTDHHLPMGNNTVMKHLQRFRKIIKTAVDMEWLEKDPFVRHKASYVKKERAYLSQAELDRLMKKELKIDRIAYVRDLFVFSCYTGLAYIDVMDLTDDHLVTGIDGGLWIHTSRQKTDVVVRVPLLDPARTIIEKYKHDPRAIHRGALFPKISNQKLNAYLKEIADVCDITKHLTHHVARHTFATTVTLSNGVPIETVSKLLGHTQISTTQIYARVLESKISDDMSKLRSKIFGDNKEKDSESNLKVI